MQLCAGRPIENLGVHLLGISDGANGGSAMVQNDLLSRMIKDIIMRELIPALNPLLLLLWACSRPLSKVPPVVNRLIIPVGGDLTMSADAVEVFELDPVIQTQDELEPVVQTQDELEPVVQDELDPVVQAQDELDPVVQAQDELEPVVQDELDPVVQAQDELEPVVQDELDPVIQAQDE
jgi:hypothetical protein